MWAPAAWGAEAYRVKAAADLNDLSGGALSGNVAGEVTHLRGGFSSDLAYAAEDTTTWNISGNLELGDQVDLRLGSSGLIDATGKSKAQTSAEIAVQRDQTEYSTGVSHLEKTTPSGRVHKMAPAQTLAHALRMSLMMTNPVTFLCRRQQRRPAG